MSALRPEIAITGAGAASALGTGCAAFLDAILRGEDGLQEVERFDVNEFSARFAGLWPGWRGRRVPSRDAGHLSTLEVAEVAAREAWASSRAAESGVAPGRVAVILGTCFGEDFERFSELTEGVARALGLRGPCVTTSTACSSSTAAIGIGRDLIEGGAADLVVAGGADVLTREVFAGFHALGALSAGRCSPFGEHAGTSLGEGAGFVVLERAEEARSRGVEPWGMVLGYGLSGDAHHETSPDPSGSGIVRAVRGALDDAAAPPEAIQHVSAHGTGTASNDAAEVTALRTALGATADRIPISGTKSLIGHAQGAAGVLELIATLLCMRSGLVPQTLRCERPRPGGPADPVPGPRPRAMKVERTLKVSAAFGGANAALVVGAPVRPRPGRARRGVEVLGWSAVGPHGLELAALERAAAEGRTLTGAVPDFDLARVVLSAPARGLDPSSRYLCAAAGQALADAQLVVRGALRERAGLFTGSSRMPAQSARRTRASIDQRGITGVAGPHFARMVINAPAGACSRMLSLKGPLLALSAGRGSGLLALVWAAEQLAARADADLLLAGGLDELPVERRDGLAEGAAFAALGAAGALGARPAVRLEGWGISGPGDPRPAVDRAMAAPEVDGVYSAGLQAAGALAGSPADPARLPLGVVDVGAIAGGAESAASAFAFVLAAAALRRGAARRLLVVAGGDSLCCAALLSAPES